MNITHKSGSWIEPGTGDSLHHGELMARMAKQNVVLLGETHDRFDIHRWQLHVAAGLLAHRSDLVMGFEMFPRRVQPILDDWIAGKLDRQAFLDQVDWKTVWGFDVELYMPLFNFCREFGVAMVALNCNRPLVTQVGKLGWDAIAQEDRDGLSPSKPATPEYRQYLFDIIGDNRGPNITATSAQDPAFDRFVRAQQTWDRAFACNIAKTLEGKNPPLMIGIIGRGHLEYGHGTPYQLDDLGIDKVSVLLPSDEERPEQTEIATALFRLNAVGEDR